VEEVPLQRPSGPVGSPLGSHQSNSVSQYVSDLCAWQDSNPRPRCLEGTLWRSLEGAGCGLMCHLAAPILAGRGLVSLSICDCWLPGWLPTIRLTAIQRQHEGVRWADAFA